MKLWRLLKMIGVSYCLIGENCTYSGSNNFVEGLKKLFDLGEVICVCPEVLGGLSIPRPPAEIQATNPLKVENNLHQDVTNEYMFGAQKALEIFIENNVKVAILKFRSPSCGNQGIYDGTFTHRLIEGQGVFAKLCEDHGIKVFNEHQISEFLKYMGKEKYSQCF